MPKLQVTATNGSDKLIKLTYDSFCDNCCRPKQSLMVILILELEMKKDN